MNNRYRVIQDPLNGYRWQVQKYYPDAKIWGDVGDPCTSQREAEAKMRRELAGDRHA